MCVTFVTSVFIPGSIALIELWLGVGNAGEILAGLGGSIFKLPVVAITQTMIELPSGLLAWPIFGLGAWFIDLANASSSPVISRYVSFAIATSLSLEAVAFVVFAPAGTPAKLG